MNSVVEVLVELDNDTLIVTAAASLNPRNPVAIEANNKAALRVDLFLGGVKKDVAPDNRLGRSMLIFSSVSSCAIIAT